MAKTPRTTTPAADAAPAQHALRYVGPPGQTSALFGALAPGQLYHTADADFADYLAVKHPDYWQRPSAAAERKE